MIVRLGIVVITAKSVLKWCISDHMGGGDICVSILVDCMIRSTSIDSIFDIERLIRFRKTIYITSIDLIDDGWYVPENYSDYCNKWHIKLVYKKSDGKVGMWA